MNPHGSLHTPLKRACLPISPPRHSLKNPYVFPSRFLIGVYLCLSICLWFFLLFDGFLFAVSAAGAAAGAAFEAGAALVLAGATAFAFAVFVLLFADWAASSAAPWVSKTERFPLIAGNESRSADNIKTVAVVIVSLDSTD